MEHKLIYNCPQLSSQHHLIAAESLDNNAVLHDTNLDLKMLLLIFPNHNQQIS